MSDKAQNVDELKSLKRIEDLLTVLARAALADRIDEIMNDKSHRVVLELTGKMTVRQLAEKTGLSPMTISRLWQKWEEIGLLAKDGKQYRRVL